MEQKKILWIIVSAALFLCVVFAAGLLWFYPSEDVKTAAGGNSGGKEANIDFDPVEWVRNSNDYPGLSDAGRKEENSGKTDEFTIVYGEDGSSSETSAAVISEKPAVNVEAAKASGAPEEQVKPAAAAPVVKQSAKENSSATVSQPVQTREYWIQAGSFKSRSGAQAAKEKLSAEGIASRITIKTVEGDDYFRVRIGPYTNKKEAEKFLDWVKKLDSFKSSYISMVTVKR